MKLSSYIINVLNQAAVDHCGYVADDHCGYVSEGSVGERWFIYTYWNSELRVGLSWNEKEGYLISLYTPELGRKLIESGAARPALLPEIPRDATEVVCVSTKEALETVLKTLAELQTPANLESEPDSPSDDHDQQHSQPNLESEPDSSSDDHDQQHSQPNLESESDSSSDDPYYQRYLDETRELSDKTECERLQKCRIGQEIYKDKLKEYWGARCAVTGLEMKELLIASHIKPWADSNDYERLDVYNGFLLAPHIDSVFDKGFITFDDKGCIIFSECIDERARLALGLSSDMRLSIAPVPEQIAYLEYHREHVFKH